MFSDVVDVYTRVEVGVRAIAVVVPIATVDMLAAGGSIYEVTGTVERSEAIGGTLEQ